MTDPNFVIFEDDTTFDVVWKRVSEEDEAPTGLGQLEDHGTFTVTRAPPPASSSSTQVSSASSIPMIATFTWENFGARYACVYHPSTRSYDNFDLVKESMSEDFASALLSADEYNTDLHTWLSEWDGGVWKLEMNTMYHSSNPSYVELWAKRRVDGVRTEATSSDRRDWGLAQDASEDEEEDEEKERIKRLILARTRAIQWVRGRKWRGRKWRERKGRGRKGRGRRRRRKTATLSRRESLRDRNGR